MSNKFYPKMKYTWLPRDMLLLIIFLLPCTFAFPCANQISENMPASFVLMHKPGVEVDYGKLHPAGALYERPTSRDNAVSAHLNFIHTLDEFNIPHLTIGEVLQNMKHSELVDLASHALKYVFPDTMLSKEKDLVDAEYKRGTLENLSPMELIEIILLRPTTHLVPSDRNTFAVTSHTEVRPLTNIVFTRDQQITTARGIIIAALHSPQREFEVQITTKVWAQMGLPILGAVKFPGKLEGGDFFPVNSTLSMIGVGLRTNEIAVHQLLNQDWFGTDKVAVVVDETDFSQDRMHLDTFFNIVKDGVCVMEENVLNADSNSNYRRMVKEYTRSQNGTYTLTQIHPSFPQYVVERMGWKIISIPEADQLAYMINFLNLGDNRIMSVHERLEEVIRKEGVEDVEIKFVDYRGITAMYGAAHCTTQVIRCL